jgi:hypothetical protein
MDIQSASLIEYPFFRYFFLRWRGGPGMGAGQEMAEPG